MKLSLRSSLRFLDRYDGLKLSIHCVARWVYETLFSLAEKRSQIWLNEKLNADIGEKYHKNLKASKEIGVYIAHLQRRI